MKSVNPNLLLVIITLAVFGVWALARIDTMAEAIAHKDSIIAEQTDSIEHWKTETGRQAAVKRAAVATAREFKEAYPALVEDLRREFKVQVKDLKAYVKAEFEARGEGTGSISNTYYIDSAGNRYREFKMDDGYLKFKTTLFDSLITAPYQYTYRDTLTYGFRTDQKWFLGKERLYGFGGLRNPNAKITSATNVLIDDYRDKRWVISVGVGYNPLKGTFYPNISAGYALIKF